MQPPLLATAPVATKASESPPPAVLPQLLRGVVVDLPPGLEDIVKGEFQELTLCPPPGLPRTSLMPLEFPPGLELFQIKAAEGETASDLTLESAPASKTKSTSWLDIPPDTSEHLLHTAVLSVARRVGGLATAKTSRKEVSPPCIEACIEIYGIATIV